MTDAEKARARIAKLLNMTVENGATEDEQENAMRLAAGIAARLGIDVDSCRAKDAPQPKATAKWKPSPLKPYEAMAAEAAAVLYGVECNAHNLGKNGFGFVGREENIELAEATMLWLIRQVELLYKGHLPRGLSKRDRADFRNSFKDACAERVYHRAIALMAKMRTDERAAQEATGQNALVVQGHFDRLRDEINTYWDERFKPTAAQIARAEAAAERERLWREANPEAAAKLDKQKEREAAKAARQAAKRKGRPERSLRYGSGTRSGAAAGDQVSLRQEIDG